MGKRNDVFTNANAFFDKEPHGKNRFGLKHLRAASPPFYGTVRKLAWFDAKITDLSSSPCKFLPAASTRKQKTPLKKIISANTLLLDKSRNHVFLYVSYIKALLFTIRPNACEKRIRAHSCRTLPLHKVADDGGVKSYLIKTFSPTFFLFGLFLFSQD